MFFKLKESKRAMQLPAPISEDTLSLPNASSGMVPKGMPIYTVLSADELVSSGPYFKTKQEALEWGFLHYYRKTTIIPNFIEGDEPDWDPVDKFRTTMDMRNALYYVTPPLLIEVYLDGDYNYDNAGLTTHDPKGFRSDGESINDEPERYTASLKEFYSPNTDKIHVGGVAKYKISVKYPKSIFQIGSGARIRITTNYIQSLITGVLGRNHRKYTQDKYTWRFYDALYLASPQNIIERQNKISIDWPNIVLSAINAMTVTANQGEEFMLSYVEKLLWDTGRNYLGDSVPVNNGMFRMDIVVANNVLGQIDTLYNAISFLSINKRLRSWFNDNVNIQLVLWKRFGPQMGDYFARISSLKEIITPNLDPFRLWDFPKETTGTKHKMYKLFKAGLCLDYKDMIDMTEHTPAINMKIAMNIASQMNGSFCTVAHIISLMWNNTNSMIRDDVTGVYRSDDIIAPVSRRQAVVPISPQWFVRNNLFSRKQAETATPKEIAIMMKPNETWAFDLVPVCFSNMNNITGVLNTITERFGDYNAVILNIRMHWRVKDDNGVFIGDVTLDVHIDPTNHKNHKLRVKMGPVESVKDPEIYALLIKSSFKTRNRGYDDDNNPTTNVERSYTTHIRFSDVYVSMINHFRLLFLHEGGYSVDITVDVL
mgnify:CR=1 FL=1